MYGQCTKKGLRTINQGKDAGNRTLCPYRNFSQAINIYIPKVIGNIEEPKANRVIKIPIFKEVQVDDRGKRSGADLEIKRGFPSSRNSISAGALGALFGCTILLIVVQAGNSKVLVQKSNSQFSKTKVNTEPKKNVCRDI